MAIQRSLHDRPMALAVVVSSTSSACVHCYYCCLSHILNSDWLCADAVQPLLTLVETAADEQRQSSIVLAAGAGIAVV